METNLGILAQFDDLMRKANVLQAGCEAGKSNLYWTFHICCDKAGMQALCCDIMWQIPCRTLLSTQSAQKTGQVASSPGINTCMPRVSSCVLVGPWAFVWSLCHLILTQGKFCCLSSRAHSFGPVPGPYLYCHSDWMWMFVFHVSLIWRNHSLVSVFSHHHLHSLLSEECLIMLAMFHNHYTNLHCQLLMECLI